MKKVIFLIALLSCTLIFAQSKADPWAGTWKLDTVKSKLNDPAPKEETVKVEESDLNTIKYTTSGTDAEGKQFTENFDGKADGKPYPLIVNGQEIGKIKYRKVSDRVYTSDGIMTDGSTVKGTVTLSKDGKSISITEHVKSSKGEYNNLVYFNKQ